MISKRFSLSRDKYSAGEIQLSGGVGAALFQPLDDPAAPTTPPNGAPAGAVTCIIADRLCGSNPGGTILFVRPIKPGGADAPEYAYPKYGNAQGSTGPEADWLAYAPANIQTSNVPAAATGIAVPAGAIAFPIELACIGLVVGGTGALYWAAYGSNKRA